MTKYFTPSSQLPLDFSGYFEKHLDKSFNPLMRLKESFNFEDYRQLLTALLERNKPKKLCSSGRRPMDPIFMLKVLFLQRLFGQSDNEFEKTMTADLRVMLFLDVYNSEEAPDAKTIWKYRELFSRLQVFEQLFDFDLESIRSQDVRVGEEIVAIDSSFMEAPKQRNSREENKIIKQGNGNQLWSDKPHKKRHKDIDARWTKKRQQSHYGYKLHTTVCLLSKFITDIYVTSANVHDAPAAEKLIKNLTLREDVLATPDHEYDFSAPKLLADAGYVGPTIENLVYDRGWMPMICQKGSRNNPLSEEQKKENRRISSVRCRIEHVFGLIEGAFKGLVTRAIGINRAMEIGALTAWVYNRYRYYQLTS